MKYFSPMKFLSSFNYWIFLKLLQRRFYFIHALLVHSSFHIWPNDETVNNCDENIIWTMKMMALVMAVWPPNDGGADDTDDGDGDDGDDGDGDGDGEEDDGADGCPTIQWWLRSAADQESCALGIRAPPPRLLYSCRKYLVFFPSLPDVHRTAPALEQNLN